MWGFQPHFCGIVIVLLLQFELEVKIIMRNDTIVITQERMAGWLMFNRFHKVEEKPDLKDSNRKIFIFKDSPILRETMGKYQQFKDSISM
jgi:DNA-binding transcriptional regulator of glucitol operon